MQLMETLNRTMKLAMDEGKVQSYEQAEALFASFRLRLCVGPGFTEQPAAEAAVLTLLNAAPKTFLGGVELAAPLEECCTLAWFAGRPLAEVARQYGVATSNCGDQYTDMPTLHIGNEVSSTGRFGLGIGFSPDGFTLSPDMASLGSAPAAVDVGVAAAGAALCEAFQYVYRQAPLAGQRNVHWALPGSRPHSHPASVWLIGLGHLGQAYLWTAALAGDGRLPQVIRLSDFDIVSGSSLSTCLLVTRQDIGRPKVMVVAEQLEALGVRVERDMRRVDLGTDGGLRAPELTLIAVDSFAFRRTLDYLGNVRVLEAGIGDGRNGFTRIQAHAFPGPRKARDIWQGDDPRATRVVDITQPAYQALLAQTGDQCGTTQVAGRAVATPFVGAVAGALLNRLAGSAERKTYAWSFDVANL